MVKCDRCWAESEKCVNVKNIKWTLRFCEKCAEETGNKRSG